MKLLDSFELDVEIKTPYGEALKKAWFEKMQEKALKKWVETKKLGLTLAK